MGAINSVPRWKPFGNAFGTIPPKLPPNGNNSSNNNNIGNEGAVATNGHGPAAFSAADVGGVNGPATAAARKNSSSPERRRSRTFSGDGTGVNIGTGTGPSSASNPNGATSALGEKSNSNIMGHSAPPLYEHALVGEWYALRSRAASHPKEASYVDRRCNAAMHLACRRQPNIDVVRALLQADPAGASRTTADGMTPLHFAAYCDAGVDVVRLLLESATEAASASASASASEKGPPSTTKTCAPGGEGVETPSSHSHSPPLCQSAPDTSHAAASNSTSASTASASSHDRRGRTPLHLALSGFRTAHRPDVVSLLLRSDPSGATRADERGRTALTLLYDDYAEEVEDALSDTVEDDDVRRMCLDKKGELRECWTILNILLQAAYHGTAPEMPTPTPPAGCGGGNSTSSIALDRSCADDGNLMQGGGGDEDGGANGRAEALTCRSPDSAVAATTGGVGLLHPPSPSPSASSPSARLATGPPAEIDLLNGPYRPLHAAVGVYETPPKFVRLVLRVLPRSASEKDGDFNLPLHVAARAVPAEHKRRKRETAPFRGGGSAAMAAMPQPTGVVVRGRSSIGWASSGGGGPAGSGAGGGGGGGDRVYNADFGLNGTGHHYHHHHNHHGHRSGGGPSAGDGIGRSSLQGMFPPAAATMAGGERRESCGWSKTSPHTAISDLIRAYPEAASIPDESGRYALVLAIQSGKNWERDVRPIFDAYPQAFGYGDGEARRAVKEALLGALVSPVAEVREEAARTIAGISSVWCGIGGAGRAAVSAAGVDDADNSEAGIADDATTNTEFVNEAASRVEDDEGGGDGGEDCSERDERNSSDAPSFVDELVRMAGRYSGVEADHARRQNSISSSAHGSGSIHGLPPGAGEDAAGIKSASLDALAGLYAHIPRRCLDLPESAESGLDVALDVVLRHGDEHVRESAARCVGSALDLLGCDRARGAMRDVLDRRRRVDAARSRGEYQALGRQFSDCGGARSEGDAAGEYDAGANGGKRTMDDDEDKDKMDDDGSDLGEESLASRHGRAAIAYCILSTPAGMAVSADADLLRDCTHLVRELMTDENACVRRAACVAAGEVLNRSPDPASTLRDVRKAIRKCMRVSEDEGVHASLARGLILACKDRTDYLLCKAGMPILDGALMLAVSSAIAPPVQRMFHGFLWMALGVGVENDRRGLTEYMRLAEGENGRIMMTLVNKTLSKIEHVEWGQW